MFNEREALKVRLEQLVEMEERTRKMFQEERKEIFNRLRELDNQDRLSTYTVGHSGKIEDTKYEQMYNLDEEIQESSEKNEFRKKGYHQKTWILRNVAIDILKQHQVAMPLKELKKEIETETGVELSNISLFMTNLMKKEDNIVKATHGQYMYVEDNS
ncbi:MULTISPECIES: Rok-like winged helix domain-containing protein [Bacillus]|uniref:Rok-like winged helix domain-containing protein n=1 Tax=Bacillus TaxID=1386 RepID=UPI0001A1940C|nr:hypothetical protein [Bacillus pseudomycoides]EEM14673.1 hypothetical protein bpmyx0001_45380 [Bacillus pseudomycoides DSM 12442]MED1597278.1 hypothetical protein [Bacillus pseudomycoides]MED4713675.1 hypothetical protein [Bacillus pseudomycoides]OOR49436.1 hypothetical protein BLX05_24290 [Bacillus pseudomycoides]PDY14818.1 hypothetical protein COO16_01080 [Bacillus pseudomycoides]